MTASSLRCFFISSISYLLGSSSDALPFYSGYVAPTSRLHLEDSETYPEYGRLLQMFGGLTNFFSSTSMASFGDRQSRLPFPPLCECVGIRDRRRPWGYQLICSTPLTITREGEEGYSNLQIILWLLLCSCFFQFVFSYLWSSSCCLAFSFD